MEGERIVFAHEIEPAHAVGVVASGEIDDSILEALSAFIDLQKKRRDGNRTHPNQSLSTKSRRKD